MASTAAQSISIRSGSDRSPTSSVFAASILVLLMLVGWSRIAVAQPVPQQNRPRPTAPPAEDEGVRPLAAALSLLVQGLTAWHLLRTSSRMAEGESVVVHAAAGGVGSFMVQTAKGMGANAMALGRTYCFGPTFRAEKSKTRRHLTEFWMVEPEVAYADLNDVIELAQEIGRAHV